MSRTASLAFLVLLVAAVVAAPLAQGAVAEVRGKVVLPPQPNGQPNGFVGPSAIYFDGSLYIFGGRMRDGGTFSSAVYKYDPVTDTTTKVAELPPATGAIDGGRYQGALAALGGRIYYFGGAAQVPVVLPGRTEAENVPTSTKEILEFDPATGQVARISAQLNKTMWGMTAVTYGDAIYVFGGFSFNIPGSEYGRHDIVQVLTLGQNPITKERTYTLRVLDSRLPLEISDMSSALVDKRIYLFGGLADHGALNPCPVNRRYNEQAQQWEEAQTTACNTDAIIAFDPLDQKVKGVTARLPYKPQWSAAAGVTGADGVQRAYVMGGQLANYAASTSIVEFDPAKLTSPTRLLTPTLPSGIIAPGVASDGQRIYLVGGRSDAQLSMSANVTFVDPGPTPPWAPRAPAAQKVGTAVKLSWDPPAYNGDSAILSYRVYRITAGEETFLDSTTDLAFTDTTIAPNAEYTYRITAVNAQGESRTSARASLTTEPVPPGRVPTLEAFPGNEEVLLRWSAPATDGGANLTGYRVYRNGSALPILSLPASQTEARDAAVENGVRYTYNVRAVNVKGEGTPSVDVPATPIAVPPAPALLGVSLEAAGVRVAWAAPDAPVNSFTVLRGTSPTGLLPVSNVSASATSYEDTGLERGRTYYYAVTASNDVGGSPPSVIQSISLVSKPGAPQNLIASPGAGEIKLTWQRPADAGEADPATLTYIIQREGRFIASDVKGTTYVDRTVLPGRNYTYAVLTFNGLQSDPSATARAAARVIENAPPIAVLAVLTSIALAGDPVELDASQSSDPDGTIASYAWDFGDGSAPLATPGASVTHAYAANGTYTIRLVVTDERGGQSQASEGSLQVGQVSATDPKGGDTTPSTPPTNEVGTGTPKIPGPGLLPLLALAAVVALVRRRLHPRE